MVARAAGGGAAKFFHGSVCERETSGVMCAMYVILFSIYNKINTPIMGTITCHA